MATLTEKDTIAAWYMRQVRFKPDKAVVKLYCQDGSLLEAVNIPTNRWPLNTSNSYRAFHYNNCQLIEDPVIAEIVDALPYHIGRCYSNAKSVTEALQEQGYDAKQYVGWLFIGPDMHPIHHSWTVLNGEHVIDLADDSAVLDYNHTQFEGLSPEETRKAFVNFSKWIQQFPHSKRTQPFGVPSPRYLYIGWPCTKEEGIDIYNALLRAVPNHPCADNVQKNGMTRLQEMMCEEGIV